MFFRSFSQMEKITFFNQLVHEIYRIDAQSRFPSIYGIYGLDVSIYGEETLQPWHGIPEKSLAGHGADYWRLI